MLAGIPVSEKGSRPADEGGSHGRIFSIDARRHTYRVRFLALTSLSVPLRSPGSIVLTFERSARKRRTATSTSSNRSVISSSKRTFTPLRLIAMSDVSGSSAERRVVGIREKGDRYGTAILDFRHHLLCPLGLQAGQELRLSQRLWSRTVEVRTETIVDARAGEPREKSPVRWLRKDDGVPHAHRQFLAAGILNGDKHCPTRCRILIRSVTSSTVVGQFAVASTARYGF